MARKSTRTTNAEFVSAESATHTPVPADSAIATLDVGSRSNARHAIAPARETAPRGLEMSSRTPPTNALPDDQTRPGRRATPIVPARRLMDLMDAAAPTLEQIRERAYFIYLERNGGPGDSLSDWLRAERELRAGSDLSPRPR